MPKPETYRCPFDNTIMTLRTKVIEINSPNLFTSYTQYICPNCLFLALFDDLDTFNNYREPKPTKDNNSRRTQRFDNKMNVNKKSRG